MKVSESRSKAAISKNICGRDPLAIASQRKEKTISQKTQRTSRTSSFILINRHQGLLGWILSLLGLLESVRGFYVVVLIASSGSNRRVVVSSCMAIHASLQRHQVRANHDAQHSQLSSEIPPDRLHHFEGARLRPLCGGKSTSTTPEDFHLHANAYTCYGIAITILELSGVATHHAPDLNSNLASPPIYPTLPTSPAPQHLNIVDY